MKKVIKWIGNICVIIAVILIIKRLYEYDIDYSILTEPKSIAILVGLSIVYGVFVVASSYPWKRIVEILTSEKIKFSDASAVAVKANLMKYLPGNVFQYVGKNELAVAKNLHHLDVASATIIDTVTNLIAVALIVVIFYANGLKKWINYYGIKTFKVLGIATLLGIILLLAIWLFRKKIMKYLQSYRRLLKRESIITILKNIAFYIFNNVCMSILYLCILKYIIGMDMQGNVSIIIGAFILSWFLGFIIPGAPGGIGIREAALTLLLGEWMNTDSVLLGIVLYRLVSTAGDIFGYIGEKLFHIQSKIAKVEESN